MKKILDGFYEMHIPHNRIHKYLLSEGLAKEEQSKKKRRKWIRYERKNSLSAGHIDWHEVDMTDIKVCVILDDASRKVLAGGEFTSIDTENSKKVIDQLVEKYWIIRPMRKLIMDHGSEFGAHRIDEKGEWDGEFKQHILKYGIKPILAGVKHPQTNGKLEKFFDAYQRFRKFFSTFDEFIEWYSNRPHGSMDFDELETPEQAFWRKLPMEAILGIGIRFLDCENMNEKY